ncbi:MAG TPA: NF038122 family metalloprotease [Oscillatoriaceae cyanobacterium M33_DOE_052]|nr:NF038122 family metalloprotease [Oscillatoriaceae cyanobacterium M33_DOE_052]
MLAKSSANNNETLPPRLGNASPREIRNMAVMFSEEQASGRTGVAKVKFGASVGIAIAAAIGLGSPSLAATFKFEYLPGTSLQEMVGFEMAGAIWSQFLTDDVTVNLKVGGVNFSSQFGSDYNKVISMASPEKMLVDAAAVAALGNLQLDGNGYFDINVDGQTVKQNQVTLSTANAKALGIGGLGNSFDGTILTNNAVGWDLDYIGTAPDDSSKFDFLSVVVHEIGHALGFISAVDDNQWYASNVNSDPDSNDNGNTIVTALDLFRFSAESSNQGIQDLSAGGEKYFSLDGGRTVAAKFATGLEGDGFQGSHWKEADANQAIGIMDPAIAKGEKSQISQFDLLALDALGWNLKRKGNGNLHSWNDLNLNTIKQQAQNRVFSSLMAQILGDFDESRTYHRWANTNRSRFWQVGYFATADDEELFNQIAAAGYFQTADTDPNQPQPASVPEPGVTLGLASLGLFGLVSRRRRPQA